MRKIKKVSNLEAYYLEYCEERNGMYKVNKPFNELTAIEKHQLEISEGFKAFLIRGIWTNVIMYFILGIIITQMVIVAELQK